jgi:hypothetical protein
MTASVGKLHSLHSAAKSSMNTLMRHKQVELSVARNAYDSWFPEHREAQEFPWPSGGSCYVKSGCDSVHAAPGPS